MPEKTIKMSLTVSAPDEITITCGTEFKQTFNRKDEPFTVEKKWALHLKRNYADFFTEVAEKPVKKAAAEIAETKDK